MSPRRRRLTEPTLTGGLPFFGGAGINHFMHGPAETCNAPATPVTYGFVGANARSCPAVRGSSSGRRR